MARSDRLILWLRWPWLGIALVLGLLRPISGSAAPSTLFPILGGAAAFAAVWLGLSLVGVRSRWITICGLVVDVFTAAALLLVTGGARGAMLPVALYPVMVAGTHLGERAGLLAAILPVLSVVASAVSTGSSAGPTPLAWLGSVLLLIVAGATAGVFRVPAPVLTPAQTQDAEEVVRLRRANKQAGIIQEMATILSSTLDYRRVLRTMVDLSVIALEDDSHKDDALTAMVLLLEAEEDFTRFRVYAGRNIPRSDQDRLVVGEEGIVARAIYGAEPVISDSAANDPILSQLMSLASAKSILCVPLRSGFDTFGAVLLASEIPDRFDMDHAQLLTTFTQQAVISIRNAQLYQDLEREERRLLEKETEARQKLARDLHDGPTQTITALVMRVGFVRMMIERGQAAEKVIAELEQIEEMARHATQEVRTMLFTLRPVLLETQGLDAALRRYVERVRQDDNLNVKLEVSDYKGQLGKEGEGVLFAIIEEVIGNVRKHSRAKNVSLRVGAQGNILRVEMVDDGVGFDVANARRRREAGHMGLLNIEERTRILGGRCSIDSEPGHGTRVLLELPLETRKPVAQ